MAQKTDFRDKHIQNDARDISLATFYFLLSAVITGWFIGEKYALYQSSNQLLLSGSIASIKWITQIIAALILLKNKKFEFIKRIATVCLVGSIVLFSIYAIEHFLEATTYQLLVALGASVITMIILFYRAVFLTDISIKWFYGWLACLTLTFSLQLTVILHII